MWTRRNFLASAAAPAFLPRHRSPREKPNVLFILADEWRAQATGYSGDPNVKTPVLDQLASESVNFENTISSCPVCCPYRASLMTGQYPLTHGVFINDVPLQPKSVTLGESFAQAGYQTGYIGKWHLYGSPDGHYGRRLSYIPPEKRFGFQYWKACECTHEYNHSLYYQDDDRAPRYWPGYDAIAQTEDACQFITSHVEARDPFFLVLSLGPPHFPYATAPQKYQDLFENLSIVLRPNVPESAKKQATSILRGYYSHMAAVDDCLQRLLQTLHSLNAEEDTIVVFTSDHGDMMYSQGLPMKLYPWEESLRVPFLLRYPRRLGRRGRKSPLLMNAPDIMPTLLGLCNIARPTAVQGHDYSPMLLGHGATRPPASAFLNLPVPITQARTYGIGEYRGVRTREFTYVRSIHGPWLLYDNTRDPYQMHNLCHRPEVKQAQAALEADLRQWLTKLGDEFLPASGYLQRSGLTNYAETKVPVGFYRSPWGDWQSSLTASNGEKQ